MSQKFPKSLPHRCKSSQEHHCSCGTERAGSTFNPACCNSLKSDTHCSSSLKVRRFKTRKERNHIRSQERSKSNHCLHHCSKDAGEKAQHHHNHPMTSRKEKPFAKPFIPQIQSIITEGRLTSIKGLFSNEIRSVNVGRVLSEETKRDKENEEPSMILITEPDSEEGPHEPETTPPKEICSKERIRDLVVPRGLHRLNKKDRRKDNDDGIAKTKGLSNPEPVVLSSSENEQVQVCKSNKTKKRNTDISQTSTLKSESQVQTCEEAFGLMDASNKILEKKESLSCLSDVDFEVVIENPANSGSCRESARRLIKRLCQASDLHVPSHRRPLLAEFKEILMQNLQKRHGFQLEQNLNRLESFISVKQTASQSSSQQIFEGSRVFKEPVEKEDGLHMRNVKFRTDNTKTQRYFPGQVKHNLERGDSIKKWIQSLPTLFRKESVERETDMSLQFDQWRVTKVPQESNNHHYQPIEQFCKQDYTFSQHAAPVLSPPLYADHPINLVSHHQLASRDKDLQKPEDFNLSGVPQQWREDPDLHIFDSRKPIPQESSFGRSSLWSQEVQNERENPGLFSFSAAYLTEGFNYEPFFRCPHPSNTKRRLVSFGASSNPWNSSAPVYPPHFF